MSSTGLLFRAVLRKRILLLLRYPINTISELVGLYVVFALIFFGGQAVVGAALADSLSGIIVGFFLFSMSIVAYGGLAWDITHEAQWGTLEQLVMTPYGISKILGMKVVADLLVSLLYGVVMLGLMLVTTGRALTIDVLTVGSVAVLGLASVVGIGFIFGALALRFKRVENALLLGEFGFLGVIAAPAESVPVLKFLPLVQGKYLLQQAMSGGMVLWEFPTTELGILIATAVLYPGIGYVILKYVIDRSRRQGVLGHY